MYKLSISSLIVVLVALQHQQVTASVSLSGQLEHLLQVIADDGEPEEQAENADLTMDYHQLSEFLAILSQHSGCQYKPLGIECRSGAALWLKWDAGHDNCRFCTVAFTEPTSLYHAGFNKFYFTRIPDQPFHIPHTLSDERESIQALNCILLI